MWSPETAFTLRQTNGLPFGDFLRAFQRKLRKSFLARCLRDATFLLH